MLLKQSTSVTVKLGPFLDSTDGNTAEASHDGCVFLTIGPGTVIVGDEVFDSVSIVGNSLYMPNNLTSTVGIRYDSGASTIARQHTLIGNNLRGQRSTYEDGSAGGSLAATYSVVRNNTARDGTGAAFGTGDWSGFIAAIFADGTNSTGNNVQ